MSPSTLTALSPVDGRYANKVDELRLIFSEYGLIKKRLEVELAWLEQLSAEPSISEVPAFSKQSKQFIASIIENFDEQEAERVKEIEATTNHDLKAVEYYIKEKLNQHPELAASSEFVHFACTSEDINNLSYALMLRQGRDEYLLPVLSTLQAKLHELAKQYADVPMLARTHGQAATPTTVGKEFANVYWRLQKEIHDISQIKICGKLNGATGNFNAHRVAYPNVDWPNLSLMFIDSLGLFYNPLTTQIEPHDYVAKLCHNMARINTICTDFARDVWGYISLGYFKQKLIGNEVGSSTMPHKVNPIDFENAEGNFNIANSLLYTLAERLPVSRWQRDLVDSTMQRNLGMAFGHTLIAVKSALKGLAKLEIDTDLLQRDLDNNWEVLGEALQTVMRRYGIEQPYEKLKALTRGHRVDAPTLHLFIDNLELPEKVKSELKQLTPANYIGYAVELAKNIQDNLDD